MKIAFRNFLTMLRRYKASSLLNIVGLTLAFTAFYIILVQVRWELTYNRSIPDADRIYLVELQSWYEPGSWQSWINRPVSERVIASASGVEAGGCSWGGFGSGLVWRQNASRMGYDKFAVSAGAISVPLLDVFSFRSVEGDVHDMARSGSVIVSRRTAERLDVGVGDMLWVDTENPSPENAREIVAVFEDFPDNSLLAECEVAYDLGDRCLDDPSEWSFNYFVKLRPGTDPGQFVAFWDGVRREMNAEAAADGGYTSDELPVRLSSLPQLYFETDARVPCAQGPRRRPGRCWASPCW